jgi:hypothetical protein
MRTARSELVGNRLADAAPAGDQSNLVFDIHVLEMNRRGDRFRPESFPLLWHRTFRERICRGHGGERCGRVCRRRRPLCRGVRHSRGEPDGSRRASRHARVPAHHSPGHCGAVAAVSCALAAEPPMIRPLRVAHRRVVLLMAIVVPLVILWALWSRPLPPVEQNWWVVQP